MALVLKYYDKDMMTNTRDKQKIGGVNLGGKKAVTIILQYVLSLIKHYDKIPLDL